MKRNCIKILLYLWISSPILSNNTDLDVRPAGGSLFETVPGRNMTIAFHVVSLSDTQEYMSEVTLPEGWKTITKEFPFTLEKSRSVLRLVSFFVPQNTVANRYEVFYAVRSRKNPTVYQTATVAVEVMPFRKIEMSVLQAPQYVIAGESYSVMLQVRNESNICDQLQLMIEKSDSLHVSADAEQFSIPTGQTRTVTIHVLTNASITQAAIHSLFYSIRCADRSEPQARAQSSVRIIPRIQGSDDRFLRFPTTWTAAFIMQRQEGRSNSGFQGRVSGEGALDEKNKVRVSFRMRGPDAYRRSISVYAERDEYTVSVWTQRIGLHAGDRSYSASSLTQNARYGRGAGLDVQAGSGLSFGVYAQKSRWFMSESRSWAAFARYSPKPDQKYQITWVDNTDVFAQGKMVSLSAALHPFPSIQVDAEAAAAVSRGRREVGWKGQFGGNRSFYSWQLNWIHASPDFPGYYRDTDFFTAGLVLRPVRNGSITLNFQNDRQNFEMDTTRLIAPLTHFLQTGAAYSVTRRLRVSVDAIRRDTRDRLSSKLFDYCEHSYRFQIDGGMDRFSASLGAETGRTENRNYGRTSSMNRVMANVRVAPDTRQSYSWYVYLDENNRYTSRPQRQVTAGFDASFQASKRVDLQLHVQNNYTPEEVYMDRNLTELAFRYTLPIGHTLQLKGRTTLIRNSLDRKDRALVAEYTAPIGIPVAVRRNSCVVKGRITDTESGRPVPDMIVRINGSTAVSDENGYYTFRNLKQKTYYLSVDRATVGLNRVTARETPIEVSAQPGKEGLTVDIGLVRSASLRGCVALDSLRASSAPASDSAFVSGAGAADSVREAGLPNILIEMTREDEVIRLISNKEGAFHFDELRPGVWKMKIYDYNIPEYHRIEKSEFEIELKPADRKIQDVRVVPIRRKVKFLQEGETSLREIRKDTVYPVVSMKTRKTSGSG